MGALLLALVVAGGWFGSVYLTTADAGSKPNSYVRETTLHRVVTVREKGKVIRKVVPVVRRPVVRYVPRIRDRVVTVGGRTRTVGETRLVPTTTIRTRTQTAVVTADRTVTATQVQTRTDERTVTNTDTQYRTVTDTQTLTETSPPVTVTTTEVLPPVTVTVLVTTTVKH